MNSAENITSALSQIKEQEDALDQSIALNKIVMQLLKTKAKESKRLWVALITSILVNLAIVGGFLWYESQWEYTTTTTTEVTQESDGDSLNMLQVGDNSRMFFGVEEDSNGQTISEDNYNQDSES